MNEELKDLDDRNIHGKVNWMILIVLEVNGLQD